MSSFASEIMSASLGHTHIFSTGQAGFIIKSSRGSLLAIDLYLSNSVERLEGSKGFKRLLPRILAPYDLTLDALICTHQHWDHFDPDSVPELISNGRTKLFCSEDCRELVELLRLGYYQENISYVGPGETRVLEDFRIKFVNCDHGSSAPGAVGVVVSVDGRNIYEAGDTCLRLDRLDEIPSPLDVLIAPINGAFGNMNSEDCAALAEALHPAMTIPCHYGMFASHHGDAGVFCDIMTRKALPFMLMRQGEKYTF